MKPNTKKVIIITILLIIAVIAITIYLTSKKTSNSNTNEQTATDQSSKQATNINTATEKDKKQEKTEDNKEQDKDPRTGNKILIAYFSKAEENNNIGTIKIGNTEIIAGHIKDYFGDNADIFKIEPVNEYPTNYNETLQIAEQERKSNARPEIKNQIPNLDQYNVIFVGYPIWDGNIPMIINTFLESYDFKDKTVIPFNTNDGTENKKSYAYIKTKLKSSEVNPKILSITESNIQEGTAEEEVLKWIEELGF